MLFKKTKIARTRTSLFRNEDDFCTIFTSTSAVTRVEIRTTVVMAYTRIVTLTVKGTIKTSSAISNDINCIKVNTKKINFKNLFSEHWKLMVYQTNHPLLVRLMYVLNKVCSHFAKYFLSAPGMHFADCRRIF